MIYLCHTGASPKRIGQKLSAASEGKSPTQWLFLGRDYLLFRDWVKALGHDWECLRYARQLQELATVWRKPYLDWLTELGRRNNNLIWWSSAIAERNTNIDSLYHSICYLRIGLDYLSKENPPLLVVVESRAVLLALANHPELRGRVRVIHSYWSILKEAVKWPASWVFYFLDASRALLDAWITRRGRVSVPPPAGKPRVLVHSCMDESYFGDDGMAHDRFFGSLAMELRCRGYDVITMPWLFNIKRSRCKAFAWFRSHPGQYLIPEDYYSICDYIWAAGIVMRQMFLLPGQRSFQDMAITLLVREDCMQQSCRIGAAHFVLYFRLIKKLAGQDMKLDYFIDTHENMTAEKPQIMAFRRFMPKVTTVGFQHYSESQAMMLCLFTTPEEAAFAPHPDVIVCNSPHMEARMAQMGFPPQKLRAGPSLRYQYMLCELATVFTEPNKVLVILTLGLDIITQIMDMLHQAFPKPEGIEFWVKPHPMLRMDLKELQKITGPLPGHFSLAEGNMNLWLPRAACAVVSASTTSFEAALAGVPVVVASREIDFDLNPLAWHSEFASPVCSPQELREQVLACLNMSGEERERLQTWARNMRKRAISPITDENVETFVQPRA
ncbi:MAG: hypothetical protein WC405_10200 [Syntrophales bacterium]